MILFFLFLVEMSGLEGFRKIIKWIQIHQTGFLIFNKGIEASLWVRMIIAVLVAYFWTQQSTKGILICNSIYGFFGFIIGDLCHVHDIENHENLNRDRGAGCHTMLSLMKKKERKVWAAFFRWVYYAGGPRGMQKLKPPFSGCPKHINKSRHLNSFYNLIMFRYETI